MTDLAAGPAVRAEGLAKCFGETVALDGVDLTMAPGEVRGLLGPNGAGKTTLLRLLLGLVRPDRGTVALLGRPLDARDAPIPEGVAGIVEEPTFYPYLSGRANLRILSELDGTAKHATIDEALERVGLARRSRDRVSGYSTGMRQRLGLAAALLRSPRVLMLDEPTNGLDPQGTAELTSLIGQLAATGVAVLVSSHLIEELEDLCDTFSIMRTGRVAWAGTGGQLRSQAPRGSFSLRTSDDPAALRLAGGPVTVRACPSGDGTLDLTGADADVDAYIMALGRADIAVRRLTLSTTPLQAMFRRLTEGEGPAGPTESRPAAESLEMSGPSDRPGEPALGRGLLP